MNITFGPVPSRRLGRSLGINNIPPKWCSYACVYCQIGNTIRLRSNRRLFYETELIDESVRSKLATLNEKNEQIDYLAFVPDGEPTLDIHLGRHIETLKKQAVPVAVITNASLINEPGVQDDLCRADWVSLKIDTVNEPTWKKINRPYGTLNLWHILDGALEFRHKFKGKLVTETMLIRDFNDSESELALIARFLMWLQPDIAYISVPTRPPAEKGIEPASPESVNRAWQIVSGRVHNTELLTGYEGNAFSASGDLKTDILSITAVHPMRDDAVTTLASGYGSDTHIIEEMVVSGEITKIWYRGHDYYLKTVRKT